MLFPVESNYSFSQGCRIADDFTDQSQRNLQNGKAMNETLYNSFNVFPANGHVDFASATTGLLVNSAQGGAGIDGTVVNDESKLLLKVGQERSIEKLQLISRPFLTVPYLGRGSCDPVLESQLMQGENMRGKKSVNTVMEKSFLDPSTYPLDQRLVDRVHDGSHTIQELAMDGWNRGGSSTRESGEKYFSKK
jgi:hypothetical protein